MKRNYEKDPIRNLNDWKLTCLEEFRDFLIKWQNNSTKGLTKPTFIAWQQSISAIIACSKYLLGKIGFYYVMPEKFKSDPI